MSAGGDSSALASVRDVCLDAQDPQRVAAFWGAVLGREVGPNGPGGGTTPDAVLRPGPLDRAPLIWVNGVPEPRTGKSRVHLDVDLAEGRSVADLLDLGATVLAEPFALGEDQEWWVLADPEGTEFCAFPASAAPFDNDADAELPA